MLDNASARNIASRAVDPLARFLLRLKISANTVTFVASISVALVVCATWSFGHFGVGLLLCLPFVFGDLLDGTMARLSGTHSAWGGFLDSVMDRVTDAAMVGSLAFWLASQSDTSGFVAAFLSLATTALIPYVRAKAESVGIECKVGIMERSERLAVIVLAVIVAATGHTQSIAIAMYVMAALNSFTVYQRMIAVYRAQSA